MVLKPCAAGTTIQRDSSDLVKATESMEVSSVVFDSCLTKKRKAEFDPEEVEESEGSGDSIELDEVTEPMEEEEESEGSGDSNYKLDEEFESEPLLLEVPDWDVDSFDGVEYISSPDSDIAPENQPYSDLEISKEDYRICKQQLIESKGFMVDPKLRPKYIYKGICAMGLESGPPNPKTYGDYCKEMVDVCLERHNQDKGTNVEFVELVRGNFRGGARPKSYITFMAREKPDGPLVEYQAKGMATLDRKTHPILCRPAPTPKPQNQN